MLNAVNTDLYELTMAAGYFSHGTHKTTATFELFVRGDTPQRAYMVFSGLHNVLDYLESLSFSDGEIEYLRNQAIFAHVDNAFFDYLKTFRFSGSVHAVPEGTIVFGNEPLIQVTAPIIEAQIIETYLLAAVHIETLVASKAARISHAAMREDRAVPAIDFGSRRAHGPEAGALAARAAYLAGCAGTSNVKAGMLYGIPTYGTMAHSWVETFSDEIQAFDAYRRIFPDKAICIVDTYDTLYAVERIITHNLPISGIRLDSGDLLELSKAARTMLDRAGMHDIKIYASGNLDEYRISELLERGAPIDGFGVGTQLVTSGDCPSLNLVYKLVQVTTPDGVTRMRCKASAGKVLYPGKKQVWRICDEAGRYCEDSIRLDSEPAPQQGYALLEPYIERGVRVKDAPSAAESRAVFLDAKSRFDASLFALADAPRYAVSFSESVEQAYRLVADRMRVPVE